MSQNEPGSGRTVTRRTTTIANLLARFDVPSTIDYLSLDVEGAEEMIMQGAPCVRGRMVYHTSNELTFLSIQLTFLSIKLTFLSIQLTFLSIQLTFLSIQLTFDAAGRATGAPMQSGS